MSRLYLSGSVSFKMIIARAINKSRWQILVKCLPVALVIFVLPAAITEHTANLANAQALIGFLTSESAAETIRSTGNGERDISLADFGHSNGL